MRRDIIHQNRRILFTISGIFWGILLICVIGIGVHYFSTVQNDKSIDQSLEKITYTEDRVEEEMDSLEKYIDMQFISNASKGKLYKALAELSYMTGDDMLYNQYVASAIYYLEKTGDTESVVYLTNNYMGRLYGNGCYESAEQLMIDLDNDYNISDFSLDMQATYYLSRADLAQMLEKDSDAMLKAADAAVLLTEDGKEKNLNQAKLDILRTRSMMQKGNWDGAAAILQNYHALDDFGYGQNQVYVVCNFEIPYFELMTKLKLHEEDVTAAEGYMDQYLAFCDQYQFRAMELHLLQYVNKQEVMQKVSGTTHYGEMERVMLQKNLSEITNEYAQILLNDMENTKETLKQEDKAAEQRRQIISVVVGFLLLVFALLFAGVIFLDYMQRDGLTKLSNRKKYEKIRLECDKKKIPYGFLILDIDNFKQVNDTYGHQKGDEVLSGISEILNTYVGRGIYAFRYGGEELCMMLLQVPEKRTREIAEEIRAKIEISNFIEDRKVTVSGGLVMSKNGENVFAEADKALYEAKMNGKNQIL